MVEWSEILDSEIRLFFLPALILRQLDQSLYKVQGHLRAP